jgi:hypothetical protein
MITSPGLAVIKLSVQDLQKHPIRMSYPITSVLIEQFSSTRKLYDYGGWSKLSSISEIIYRIDDYFLTYFNRFSLISSSNN